MEKLHPKIENLLKCIELEDREQEKRFQLDQQNSLKQLKAAGVALHPINVLRKSFGYADYPEISFKMLFSADTSAFKDNCAIECFLEGEQSVKGVLLGVDGSKGEFRLFAPDFPDWIEEKGVGIKLTPDMHTSEWMKKALLQIPKNLVLSELFSSMHDENPGQDAVDEKNLHSENLTFVNTALNPSQQHAVEKCSVTEGLSIIHGPPGTGKTSTLNELILQLVKKKERIIATAPSNAAVDHLASTLLQSGVKILRVGNNLKVNPDIFPHTPEGRLGEAKEAKELKKLKIRAEELRKMAYQYKRNFGKDERDQRKLLMQEVKNIRHEIRKVRDHFNETLFDQADVILGTPIGLADFMPKNSLFDTLIIDEAGQLLEPLAWILFPFAQKWILAGDPFQLPPTVLSSEAQKLGFNRSILEQAIKNCSSLYFLNTQYRMRESIAAFPSAYFYNNELLTPAHKQDVGEHLHFYDTAGTGFEEAMGEDGSSLSNEGELSLIPNLLERLNLNPEHTTFISPYSAQIELAKKLLPNTIKIKTIDSFQGQENECIIISLVRSNGEGNIGFLNDYRRMNVALTRAKEQLIVIGDSATLANDAFYQQFLEFVEGKNAYRSAWELMG